MGIRRLVATGTIAALVVSGGVVESAAAAATHIQRQLFTIGIDPTGAITSVNQVNYRSDGSKSQSQLPPTSVSSSLPVSLQFSYIYRGRTGTNLSDLRGKRGAVEIDVTVKNATQEQYEWTDQTNGNSYTALNSEPVTVLLSATVPQHSFASLGAPPSGTTPQSATSAGVIGVSSSGAPLVQWGSILAPPVLSGTSTFRLRETTQHFTLPTFTLVANPGIVTDASLSAFFSQNTTQSIDGKLIAQNNVTLTLLDKLIAETSLASQTVQVVHNLLGGPAKEYTSTAAKNLRLDGQTIASFLAGLNTSFGKQLSSIQGDLKTQATELDTQLGSVKSDVDCVVSGSNCPTAQVRVPSVQQIPRDGTDACSQTSTVGTQRSVIALINAFADAAIAATTATKNCVAGIRVETQATYAELQAELAQTNSAYADVETALETATVDATTEWSSSGWTGVAQLDLKNVAQGVDALQSSIASTSAPTPSSAGSALQTVVGDLETLQTSSGNVASWTSSATTDFTSLDGAVASAQSLLSSTQLDLATLSTAVGAVQAAVAAEYNADGVSGNSQQMVATIANVVQSVCASDVQTALATASSTADTLSTELTGYSCADELANPAPPPLAGSLAAMASSNVADWQAISEANIGSALSSISSDVSSMTSAFSTIGTALTTISQDLTTLQGAVAVAGTGVTTANADATIAESALLDQVDALEGAAATLCSGTCWDAGSGSISSASNGAVATLATDLTHYFDEVNVADSGQVASSVETLKRKVDDSSSALKPTSGAIDVALSNLINSSEVTGQHFGTATTSGENNLQDLQSALETEITQATNGLNSDASTEIASLGMQASAAQTQLNKEKHNLQRQFLEVLKVLGFTANLTRTGGGLANVLNSGATSSGEALSQLSQTSSQSSASSVRDSLTTVALQLQLEELRRGLARVSTSPQQIYVFQVR